MLPNREGRFKAIIVEYGVSETGQNHLATWTAKFRLLEELANGEWLACDAEGFEITGYFYLEKKDGTLNTTTIDALKAALGWDGRDPFWLQDADLTQTIVQLKLAYEEYNGQIRIKVKFIDAENATPNDVPKADDAGRRSINTRLGAKFRANAGGAPAPAPKPPAGSRPTPPKPAPTSPTKGLTMQEAWDAFVKACPPNSDQKQIESEWFRLLGEMFPGQQPEELTPQEWARFVEVPF